MPAYNAIDDPALRLIMGILGIYHYPETYLNNAPGGKGQIVYETDSGRTPGRRLLVLTDRTQTRWQWLSSLTQCSTFNTRSGGLGSSSL